MSDASVRSCVSHIANSCCRRHDAHMDPADDPDLADDFLRQNFDPPANQQLMREKVQLFCSKVPKNVPIVLISVSVAAVVTIDDLRCMSEVGRHYRSTGEEHGSIRGQLLCWNTGICFS